MFGNLPLILPFGILPLILIVGYILYIKLGDSSNKHIGSKTRKGKDEFPMEISSLWISKQINDLAFSHDGKSVSFTKKPLFQDSLDTNEDVKEEIKQTLAECRIHNSENQFEGWIDHCRIHSTQKDPETGLYRINLSPDDVLVKNIHYVRHEINNMGRIMMSNTTTNDARYLTSFPENNQCVRSEDGRLLVTINRNQSVPTFFDGQKEITMSAKQITRNLQNRLWNRVEVHCLSIDDTTYHGEIVGL
jgi:hypothetical protein